MSHSCPNLVSTSFLYNSYIPFFNLQKFFIYYIEIINTLLAQRGAHVLDIYMRDGFCVCCFTSIGSKGSPSSASYPKISCEQRD